MYKRFLWYTFGMKKLLIADDSSSWRNYHTDAVQKLFPEKFEIETADFANSANEKLYLNADEPYDVILTDLQMESDFLPLYAGEWLVEQIQKIPAYKNTKIIIISATNAIRLIAERYNVDYIPKYNCRDINAYSIIEK